MRFRPRHYVLIALIVALGMYNFYRSHHPHTPSTVAAPTAQPRAVEPTPPQAAAAWTAFDKAAGLRDASSDQFSPAAQELEHQIEIAQPQSAVSDVKGCQLWLLKYHDSVAHPSRDTTWHDLSTNHVNTCMSQHADLG